jgi:hypothetical protein
MPNVQFSPFAIEHPLTDRAQNEERRQRLDDSLYLTVASLLVAASGGVALVVYGESLLLDIQSTSEQNAPRLADWQVHAGAACMGAAAFVVILLLLEILGRQSRKSA